MDNMSLETANVNTANIFLLTILLCNCSISFVIITYAKHAEEMLDERELPRSLVEKTVVKPDWVETGTETTSAFKRAEGKVLRVTYVKKTDNELRVITAFYDRRKK